MCGVVFKRSVSHDLLKINGSLAGDKGGTLTGKLSYYVFIYYREHLIYIIDIDLKKKEFKSKCHRGTLSLML